VRLAVGPDAQSGPTVSTFIVSIRNPKERLRPPVQLADSIPRVEVRGPLACLELPIFVSLYAEAPGDLSNREATTWAILLQHLRERRQARHRRSL
jgi:hypothetical protein